LSSAGSASGGAELLTGMMSFNRPSAGFMLMGKKRLTFRAR
jgi:hypothetical protein